MTDLSHSATANPSCFAVIGDMVASRSIRPNERQHVQQQFSGFAATLNRRYQPALLSGFAITIGDEFQALIADPAIIPDIIWDVERSAPRPMRLGFGYGAIETEIPRFAINLDGPALHLARAAIDEAKTRKLLGGVFRGPDLPEPQLNGFARLLWFHRSRRTQQQLKVLSLLRSGLSQVEIAQRLHQTPQAVYDHAKASGWQAYREGEAGFRTALASIGKSQ